MYYFLDIGSGRVEETDIPDSTFLGGIKTSEAHYLAYRLDKTIQNNNLAGNSSVIWANHSALRELERAAIVGADQSNIYLKLSLEVVGPNGYPATIDNVATCDKCGSCESEIFRGGSQTIQICCGCGARISAG